MVCGTQKKQEKEREVQGSGKSSVPYFVVLCVCTNRGEIRVLTVKVPFSRKKGEVAQRTSKRNYLQTRRIDKSRESSIVSERKSITKRGEVSYRKKRRTALPPSGGEKEFKTPWNPGCETYEGEQDSRAV